MPPDLHFKSYLAVRRPGSWPSGQHLASCTFGGQEAWMALSATNFVLALVQPEACRRVVLSSLSSGESWPLGEALRSVPGDPVWARRPLLAAHGASSRRKKRLLYRRVLCPGGDFPLGAGGLPVERKQPEPQVSSERRAPRRPLHTPHLRLPKITPQREPPHSLPSAEEVRCQPGPRTATRGG